MTEGDSAVVRIALLNQHMAVETSHLRDGEDTNAAERTGLDRQDFALGDVAAKHAVGVALEAVECDLARCKVGLERAAGEVRRAAVLNEFISRIEVHERDQKRARYAIQHISIYFNYIGKFENEVTQLAEPTEQEIRQMREEIEEAKKEKSRAYHRQYSREYRARNLEKQREYDRIKAREYRARRKAQTAAAQPAQ